MFKLVSRALLYLRSLARDRSDLVLENMALRHQLLLLQRQSKQPKSKPMDRLLWSQTPPRFLLRDRDSIYGAVFTQRVRALGMKELNIAPRCPWQNPYVERLIGTLRRECLDQLLILNAAHLHRILNRFFDYYHQVRPHRSLDHDAPGLRPVEGPEQGQVIELPVLGGLHHRYSRRAA